MLDEEFLCIVGGRPKSGKLLPEEDRWKDGCGGRPCGARDILDEDIDRPWFVVWGAAFSLIFEIEFDLFIAEAGCGIEEL